MTWLEVSLHTTDEALDWVRPLLAGTDYISDLTIVPYLLPIDEAPSPSGAVVPWTFTVRFYFLHDFQANTRLDAIEHLFTSLQRTGLMSELDVMLVDAKLDPENMTNTPIQRIGQHFVVLSPEQDYHPATDDVLLRLEQTLSFGSGSHPTTIAILRLLERHVHQGMHTLDLGCGSGILSVAMTKLGATVLALDNDSVAVQATQNAISQNHVADQVMVAQGSLGCGNEMGHWLNQDISPSNSDRPVTGKFDLIAANVLARMHVALADDYRDALNQPTLDSTCLVISGFTTDYEADIDAALTDAGFVMGDREQLNEWVALAYHR